MSFNRKTALLSIRPTITTVHQPDLELEKFQNKTLRPILKFQNDLILKVMQQYLLKRKLIPRNDSGIPLASSIEKCLKTDQRFKHLLEGIILGQLTVEEWEFFEQRDKEFRKRITAMLIQRICNQIDYF